MLAATTPASTTQPTLLFELVATRRLSTTRRALADSCRIKTITRPTTNAPRADGEKFISSIVSDPVEIWQAASRLEELIAGAKPPLGFLARRQRLCQHLMMKSFVLMCLLPTVAAAQSAQLTEQLGKTVLYGGVAISPDGNQVAWVQSTAASTVKETHVMATSGNATPSRVSLPGTGDRSDSDPAWSPDSKTLAFFSTAGEKNDQRQLWIVKAD